MRTPITYYGGKQRLVRHLLELVPPHRIYCEPFFGGGALFFAKPKAEVEVINDRNGELVNFFRVVKTKFRALQQEIRATPHSRDLYQKAMVVYLYPELFTDVKRAWAIWTLTNQGFASMIGSWGFGKDDTKESALARKREEFTLHLASRLERVQIECNDALKVIDRCETPETFAYCDPPYIGSDMGHYKGYSAEDYTALLERLTRFKGKFLLSSYPGKILDTYIRKNDWYLKEIELPVAVTKNTDKRKTEQLVMNYSPAELLLLRQKPTARQVEEALEQLSF